MAKAALIRAVLFDLDGTLIDSAPDLGAAADRMRTTRGLPSLPDEAYRPMAGAGARGMLGVAFGMGTDHPEFADIREEFFQNYERAMTVRTRIFEGVPELLLALQARGLAWGVVTNKAKRFTEPLVRQLPALAGASCVVSGDTPRMPSHTRRRCWRRRASCSCRPRRVGMWATTSATSWRAWPRA